MPLYAVQVNIEAYNKLVQLVSIFHGTKPFSCMAIAEVKYKENRNNPLRDTSSLIYNNKLTYYKSRRVEKTEGAIGNIIINHELREVHLQLSDSIRTAIYERYGTKQKGNQDIVAMLEENPEEVDVASFKKFLTENCIVSWQSKEGIDEIAFRPKQPGNAEILSLIIRFKDSKVLHYEYSYRDIYAKDYYGNDKFRIIRTVYTNFSYENVPPIPVKLSDLIYWNASQVRLKKFTNYTFSVL